MIKIRTDGKTVDFTGKDAQWLSKLAKEYGLSLQHLFTILMLEAVLREARNGAFKKAVDSK